MLLATGCFTLVYVLGTAAAVRLLPRGSRVWWSAVVALASVIALLAVTGLHVLWALGIAAAALAYQARQPRRRSRHPVGNVSLMPGDELGT
jgi:amino acid efflux transporter